MSCRHLSEQRGGFRKRRGCQRAAADLKMLSCGSYKCVVQDVSRTETVTNIRVPVCNNCFSCEILEDLPWKEAKERPEMVEDVPCYETFQYTHLVLRGRIKYKREFNHDNLVLRNPNCFLLCSFSVKKMEISQISCARTQLLRYRYPTLLGFEHVIVKELQSNCKLCLKAIQKIYFKLYWVSSCEVFRCTTTQNRIPSLVFHHDFIQKSTVSLFTDHLTFMKEIQGKNPFWIKNSDQICPKDRLTFICCFVKAWNILNE